MIRQRSTDDLVQEQAERELIRDNRVAHAAMLKQDPEFRSHAGQPLPDRYYVTARNIAREHGQDAADEFMSAEISKRAVADSMREQAMLKALRKHSPYHLGRVGAAAHTFLQVGVLSAILLVPIWAVSTWPNFVISVTLASGYTAFRVAVSLASGEVI